MKKLTILALGIITLSLSSCKKDRTCECTETETQGNTITVTTINATFSEIKKRDAKDACSNYAYTTTSSGSTYSSKVDCKLK